MRRRLSASTLLLPAALASLVACDPLYSVTGTVQDSKGAPIAGATVTMTCPDGWSESARTTVSGAFAFGGVGRAAEADRCSLRIEKPGLRMQTAATTSACFRSTKAGNVGEACRSGEGRFTLAP